ncbi:MAG: hypothetical protein PHN64_03940 [Desulfovibrionaceae bacterium]|nr:hypothetical protein [Desulfovibrionaceae bacterium]
MDDTMRVNLERRAVEIFENKRIALGMSVDALAAKLYPEVPLANARMTLNRLRKAQVTGKPKRLLFGDFIDMCAALDLIPERVVTQAVTEVLEKETK